MAWALVLAVVAWARPQFSASKNAPDATSSLTIFPSIGVSNFVSDVAGGFYRLKVKALFAVRNQNQPANQAILCATPARRRKFRVYINRRRHDRAGNNEGWAGAA
jgi:hypothetical protein